MLPELSLCDLAGANRRKGEPGCEALAHCSVFLSVLGLDLLAVADFAFVYSQRETALRIDANPSLEQN
jgi:hypothetical protein